MSIPLLYSLIAGTFATAIRALSTGSYSAEDLTQTQKNARAEHSALIQSGKVEPCFGIAVRGQNDGYAAVGTRFACSSWTDWQ